MVKNFFLKSISEQAKETQKLINKIIEVKRETEEMIKFIKSPYIYKLINIMISKPIFQAKDLKLPRNTANRLLTKLVNLNILKTLKIKNFKGKVYIFEKLVKLLSY